MNLTKMTLAALTISPLTAAADDAKLPRPPLSRE